MKPKYAVGDIILTNDIVVEARRKHTELWEQPKVIEVRQHHLENKKAIIITKDNKGNCKFAFENQKSLVDGHISIVNKKIGNLYELVDKATPMKVIPTLSSLGLCPKCKSPMNDFF